MVRKNICSLCKKSSKIKFSGKVYEFNEGIVHYDCLLFTTNLFPKSNTSKGIEGFQIKDITKMIKISAERKCIYCQKNGAHVKCSKENCKVYYHHSCGVKKGSLNRYYGFHESFCPDHYPIQKLPGDIINNKNNCVYCLCKVSLKTRSKFISTPCCKSTILHKSCLQKMALSAGLHHFRCPACNNVDKFQEQMLKFGIKIPIQDAIWELEENAYGDLYIQHSSCDAPICLCPNGRGHSTPTGKWFLHLCFTCGSKGIHKQCLNDQSVVNWNCADCISIFQCTDG